MQLWTLLSGSLWRSPVQRHSPRNVHGDPPCTNQTSSDIKGQKQRLYCQRQGDRRDGDRQGRAKHIGRLTFDGTEVCYGFRVQLLILC